MLAPASLVAAGGVVFFDTVPIVPFPGYTGPLSVALAGDLDANGYRDILVGAGAGGGPRVALIDTRTLAHLADLFAYEPTFLGGVNVAYDGATNRVYVGSGKGGGPVVVTYDARTYRQTDREFYGDPADRGGVAVDADSLYQQDTNPDETLGSGAYKVFLNFQGLVTAGDGTRLAGDIYAFYRPLGDLLQLVTRKPVDFPGRYLTVNFFDDLGYLPAGPEGVLGYASGTIAQRSSDYETRTVYASGTLDAGAKARVAVHEMGHFFGLDHSSDPANVMFASLAPSYDPATFSVTQLAAMRANIAGRA